MMRKGHEECGHDRETATIAALAGPMCEDVTITCHHDHAEKLYASDEAGFSHLVGKFCECCDRLIERY